MLLPTTVFYLISPERLHVSRESKELFYGRIKQNKSMWESRTVEGAGCLMNTFKQHFKLGSNYGLWALREK